MRFFCLDDKGDVAKEEIVTNSCLKLKQYAKKDLKKVCYISDEPKDEPDNNEPCKCLKNIDKITKKNGATSKCVKDHKKSPTFRLTCENGNEMTKSTKCRKFTAAFNNLTC